MDDGLVPTMSNRAKIASAVEAAIASTEPIDDATAQAIAAWWAEGDGAVRLLADTGAIVIGIMLELVHAHEEAGTVEEKLNVSALIAYAGWHGPRSVQDGWPR